jgi:hypothetical protein
MSFDEGNQQKYITGTLVGPYIEITTTPRYQFLKLLRFPAPGASRYGWAGQG